MNNLTDYYKSTGGTLGATVADRFADPNFAKAAQMAGFNNTNYQINGNNAAANTAILNNLKVLQASGGIQNANTGAVQTTGNQTNKDANLTNNVNGWLNGTNGNANANGGTANNSNPTPTGNTSVGNTGNNNIDFSTTPFTQGADGVKKYLNQKTGQYDITEASQTAPKIQRTSTDPLQQAYYDSVDQANAVAEQQIQTLFTQLEPARQRLNAANQALVDQIHSNFDQARKLQSDVNASIQAGTEKMGILSGRSRYTPETQQGIQAQEMQAGIDRITALNVQEADLTAKAEAARSKDDFDALYKIWNEYNDIKTKTNTAVADLYKQSVTATKNAQDAQIAKLKATQASVTDQLKVVDQVAPAIAAELVKMPANLQATYIEKVAKEYGVDANVIRGAVIDYTNTRTDKQKTAGSAGGGTAGERAAYKENTGYSNVDQLVAEDNFAFEVPGKDPVQLKDDNGYITPQGFRLLNARLLRTAGISREEFIKQYPELFYTKGSEVSNYGFTAAEKKLLGLE